MTMATTTQDAGIQARDIRVYFRYDKASVPSAVCDLITQHSRYLNPIDNTLFTFDFSPTVFTHAWQLLGKSPTRYGVDLSLYLHSVAGFFLRSGQGETLCMTMGTSDFKRRMSEDLGVALASLFMFDVFGIEWHTIAHIPANTKLSKTRPDFEGYAGTDRYLYEAKGRSTVHSVIEAIADAVSQVKTYPESAVQKLALVSYICSDERAFASQLFLADPEMPNNVPADKTTAEQLHIISVLEFAGLTESMKAYVELLRSRFAKKSASSMAGGIGNTRSTASYDRKSDAAILKFTTAWDMETSTLSRIEHNGRQFIARSNEWPFGEHTFRITNGIAPEVKPLALQGETSRVVPEPSLDNENGASTSVFTDGTLLRVALIS